MNYKQALAKALELAKRRGEWVHVVIEDTLWGTYDTATEHDLETFHLGATPLVSVSPEGEVCQC